MMKPSLQASPRSWESTVSQREEVRHKLGSKGDRTAQSQRICPLCIQVGGEMKEARQLAGMLYRNLAWPSKGQPDAVESLQWSPSLFADSWACSNFSTLSIAQGAHQRLSQSVPWSTFFLGFCHTRQREPGVPCLRAP